VSERTKAPPRLDADRLLDDPRTRIIVCCGSGGVGKTTTAAALGLRAAGAGGTWWCSPSIRPAGSQSMGLSA
jgi:flagellar biosynthesis GTPase FlhF